MTDEEFAADPRNLYGVTVSAVMSKIKMLTLGEGSAVPLEGTGVPVNGGGNRRTEITRAEVEEAIIDVTTRVRGHVVGYGALPDTVTEHITTMAADLVKLGAAAYIIDAAFPAGQGPNSLSEYSERLWSRHESGLLLLRNIAEAHGDADGDGLPDVTPVAGSVAVFADLPTFSEWDRW